MLAALPLLAQQLPDPSFEDWSGAKFDGNIQPKYWNFSNVSQLGIANFNYAERVEGRNGYAMKVQDQSMTVMGIGETGPGYISLGHPWAYVPSIGEINKATAGTYGGISWTSRPDTMEVWIKREGPKTADENYNILFYSWRGTSEAVSYKGKGGDCTTVPDTYRFDEESDIRITLDGNECATTTPGQQIAEGWIYERKTYSNWTRIRIPIYYMNDLAPEKCNVIFSAGNYPNFRATTGLNAGNSITVDDVRLIYSSAIQKLYINNKEWKAFDGSNHEVQTYALGQGATEIPSIVAYRGSGKLTNVKGKSATFSGRKLGSNEVTITKGQVDGEPCKITVKAEDGSSVSTYYIQFVSQQSSNSRLAGIKVNDTPLANFNALVENYNISLPYGTTTAPVVSATPQESSQSIKITQATSPSGKATIEVTAQDGKTTTVYTLNFSVAQLSDNTLKDILINGSSLPGFSPTKSNYTVELPLTTTETPVVTPVSAYAEGAQTIKIETNTLDIEAQTGLCKISVSAPAATTARTYTLNYKITQSSNSRLKMIYLDGEPLKDYSEEQTAYSIMLEKGTKTLPTITWTVGDEYQSVNLVEGGVEGVTRLTVMAGNGSTTLYRLSFSVEKSTNAALNGILLDGEPLADFDAQTKDYTVTLPAGTKVAPTVTAVSTDDEQSVRIVSGGLVSPTRIIVTAGDGVTTCTYTITFVVERSLNAYLEMIYLDGEELQDFDKEVFEYRYQLSDGQQVPRVTVRKMEGQQVVISQPLSAGVARIDVLPEEGEGNTYSVVFYSENDVIIPEPVEPKYIYSTDARARMIYLDGEPLEGFDAEKEDYTIVLATGTAEQPIVTAEAMSALATEVIITQGEVDASATVRIVSEGGAAEKTYTLYFPLVRSTNAVPEDIDVDGRLVFDGSILDYTVLFQYGETFPEIYVTKAEEAQRVEISYANCRNKRDVEITVTAADGVTTNTYTVHMAIENHPENVLLGLNAGMVVLDSAALNAEGDIYVDVPFDATSLGILSIQKAFPEQYLVVNDGGAIRPTTIWVYAGRSSEETPRIYTLVPRRAKSPMLLTDLTVDGTTIDGFSSERFDYILAVESSSPTIVATAMPEAKIDVLADDSKHYQVAVEYNDSVVSTYTVWYYYPNDVIPNADFTEWGTAVNNNAAKPLGWTVPADVIASQRVGLGTYNVGNEVAKNNDNTVRLNCINAQGTIGGAFPGMMTLGTMTASLAIANGTSSSCSGGISFRNSPDYFSVRYRPISNQRITGMHFVVAFNEGTVNERTVNYASVTKNAWYVDTLALTNNVLEPSLFNIVLNAGQTENASDLGGSFLAAASSSMDVDWVRIWYNSELRGIIYDGNTIAPAANNHFSIDVPSEFVGIPALGFAHSVADQATEIVWGDEVEGVREATIRNYGEDLGYTDYTLSVVRPKSTNALYATSDSEVWADKVIVTESAYATVMTAIEGDSLIITVTAEAGNQSQSVITLFTHDTIHTVIEAVLPDGRDSISMIAMPIPRSEELGLGAILLDGDTISGFEASKLNYTIYNPETQVVSVSPLDAQQTVTIETVQLADGSDWTYIYVRSGSGTTRTYSVRQLHYTPSSDAALSAIYLNGELLANFDADVTEYTVSLAAHSTLPDVEAVLRDAGATLTLSRARSLTTLSIVVLAEDGVTTRTYTIYFDIAASDYAYLSMILLDDAPLENYSPTLFSYDITLPALTKSLPEITYIKAEDGQSVSLSSDSEGALTPGVAVTYTLTVTAEDGVHQAVYTLRFEVELSTNALLADILADGVSIPDFYAERQEAMAISVAYGQTKPEITWVKAEEAQQVVLTSSSDDATDTEVYTLTVTAEDGVTQHVYTIIVTYLKSTNADLLMLYYDGQMVPDFAADNYEYFVSLPSGSTLPTVTADAGDEQQTVDISWQDSTCTVLVTSGDGENVSEYTIYFTILLSDNAYLRDLQIRGKTIAAFEKQKFEYLLEYAWGTKDSLLVRLDDVLAIAEETDAAVSLSIDDNKAITITVLAPDGVTMQVYRIEQFIAQNAQLRMIYVNGVPLRDFDPNIYEYEYELPDGVQSVELTAEPLDPTSLVDYSPLTLDSLSYIFCSSADESLETMYSVYIYHTTRNTSLEPTVNDCVFVPVGPYRYKAVTIRSDVQVGVYDYMGHMLLLESVPVCDPYFVEVKTNDNGEEYISQVYDGANGVEFNVPTSGTPFIYVFYRSTTNKRFTKGGKFMCR